MRKEIPPHSFSRRLIPPSAPGEPPEKHKFLENALDHPFEARPKQNAGHSPVNAWWLAELSLLAYNELGEIKAVLEPLNLKVRTLDKKSTQGFVAEGKDFVIVSFRGTEFPLPRKDQDPKAAIMALFSAITDDVVDLRFGLVPAPGPARGRVHGGFVHALDEVFDQLSGLKLPGPGRTLWLTGHSLGGALAILAAARLPNVQGVYTYGAPSMGDADFKASFRGRARPFRFVHEKDFVTRLLVAAPLVPPELPLTFIGKFEPEGTIVAFDREGRLHTDAPSNLDADLGSLGRRLLDRLPTNDLLDHAPLFYAIHLWNQFDKTLT
jgi:triacylglycerol lipase